MDKIQKALARFSGDEYSQARELLDRILVNNLVGLNVKKLSLYKDMYRVRKGKVRVVFKILPDKRTEVIFIGRRKEDTYKNL